MLATKVKKKPEVVQVIPIPVPGPAGERNQVKIELRPIGQRWNSGWSAIGADLSFAVDLKHHGEIFSFADKRAAIAAACTGLLGGMERARNSFGTGKIAKDNIRDLEKAVRKFRQKHESGTPVVLLPTEQAIANRAEARKANAKRIREEKAAKNARPKYGTGPLFEKTSKNGPSPSTALVPAATPETPLTAADRRRLGKLEKVIDDRKEAFRELGEALAEIRRDKLYCETHDSFEAYCRDRFGFGKAEAYDKIKAAEVAEVIAPIAARLKLPPPVEDHLKALAPVEDAADRKAIYEAAAKRAAKEDVPMTGKLLREERRRYETPEEDLERERERREEQARNRQPLAAPPSAKPRDGLGMFAQGPGDDPTEGMFPPSPVPIGGSSRGMQDAMLGDSARGLWNGQPRPYARDLGLLRMRLKALTHIGKHASWPGYREDLASMLRDVANQIGEPLFEYPPETETVGKPR